MGSTSLPFTWGTKQYASVYAAFLDNAPLEHPARNLNAYVNSFFVPAFLVESICNLCGSLELAHYVVCYIRNLVAGLLVYYGTAGVFHYFCYIHPSTSKVYEKRQRPTADVIWSQIKLAQASLFIYTMLPVIDDWLVEQGWTQVYHTVEEIGGWSRHIFAMIFYFSLVEIGIYWMHRTLHTNKFLYKHVHLLHHQYKTPESLTPWASIAFHPLDGMLQASPYVGWIFFTPCHYLCHVGLLFFTALWATYIHDSVRIASAFAGRRLLLLLQMDFNIDPIMGSKYHTVHHTHYVYNYGQVFTFCDWFWGTLRIPTEPTGFGKQILKKLD